MFHLNYYTVIADIAFCEPTPVTVYFNVDTDKLLNFKDNKRKAGIYLWIHEWSGKYMCWLCFWSI